MQGDGSSKEAHGDPNGAAPSEKPDMNGQGKPDGMKAPDSEGGNGQGGFGGPGGQSASGAADITFTDENSSTKWDKTGASDETCELTGDFFIGAYSNNEGTTPDIGTGANSLKAAFVNSEWEGTVLYGDDEELNN